MKRKIVTTVNWPFEKHGMPPLVTNLILVGARLYIAEVRAVLDQRGIMSVSFLLEEKESWTSEREDALKALIQQLISEGEFSGGCRDHIWSPRRLCCLLFFKRVRGEEFSKTTLRLFSELLKAMEIPRPWRTIIAPTITQETHVTRGHATVPYGVHLAGETYWEGVR